MAETYTVEAKLIADINGFTANLKKASGQMGAFAQEAEKSTSGAKRSISGLTDSLKGIAAATGVFKVVDAGLNAITNSISGAVARFDTLNAYPKIMKQMGFSTEDTNKSIKILKKGVDGLPTSLQDISTSAQSFAILTKSASEGADVAVALNDAFIASGASAGDASRGVTQYSQMLASGKVDMVGYRSLMETMPSALYTVAKSFGFAGKSAEQDLYKALQSGDITMDQLNQRFIDLDKSSGGFAEQARTASGGIQTSFTNMSNAVQNGMADMLTSIDKGLRRANLGGIASVFDKAKVAINDAFDSINSVISDSIPTIVDSIKGMVDYVKSNQDWLKPLSLGVMAFLPFTNNAKGGFNSVLDAFTNTKNSISAGKGWLSPLSKGITDFLSNIPVFGGALSTVANGLLGLKGPATQAADGVEKTVLALLKMAPGATAGIGPIGGLVTAMGGLGQGESLISGFTGALSGLSKFVPVVGGIISVALSPAGLGLIAAGTAFWALHDSGTESMSDLANQLLTGNFSGAMKAIKDSVDNVVQAFQQVDWATIGGIWSSGIQGIVDSFSVFSTSSSEHTGKVKTDIQTTSDKIALLATGVTVAFAAIGLSVATLSTVFWGLATVVEAVVRGIIAIWDLASGDIDGAVSVMSNNVSGKMTEMSFKSAQSMADMAQQGIQHMNSLRDGTAQSSQAIHDSLTNQTATGSKNAVDNLNAAAGGADRAMQNAANSAGTGANQMANNVTNGALQANNGMNSGMSQAVTTATNKMGDAVRGADSHKSEFRTAGEQASKALGSGVDSVNLHKNGSSVMQSFQKGLEDAWGSVKSFISGIGPWISAHKGPISYDRKLLIPAGNAIMSGLNNGLQDSFTSVQSTVNGMAGAIQSAFSGGVDYRINPVTNGMKLNTDGTMSMRLDSQTQPAYVNLSMGGTTYRAFVDDISHQQGRKATLNTVASVY